MVTTKHYSGHCKATEEAADQRRSGKEISGKKCGELEEDGGGSIRWS